MPSVQHLLETQFSVNMGRELSTAWLEGRMALLHQYTLPAVAAQTTDAFTWLVLCDQATDPDILEQLRDEGLRLPNLRVELTDEERPPLDAVRSAVRADTDVLITTRLDSDDAVADRYLEAIQDYAESFHRSRHEALLVNFPHGYRLDIQHDRLHADWMPNSSFHSFFERPRRGLPKTVKGPGHGDLRPFYESRYRRLQVLGPRGAGAPHVRLHHHYPTHQDVSMPAWLITVHGGNLINRIDPSDRSLPPGSRPSGFTLAAEGRG